MSIAQELKNARKKSAKPMLWVAMVSMTMLFAGLTSAYLISGNREDWVSFDIPNAFWCSTGFIILSSFTFQIAKTKIQKTRTKSATLFLIGTFLLALGFLASQYWGFHQLQEMGLFFTGAKSNVSSSMFMVIVFAHFLHLLAGLICILVVIYNHFNLKYNAKNLLGFELALLFWHFLGVLWLGLFFFFYNFT